MVRRREVTAIVMLILGTIVLGGCGGDGEQAQIPTDVRSALDTTLDYLRENYSGEAPSSGLEWTGEESTEEGVVGAETYRFTAEGWEVVITAPVVEPSQAVYYVEVTSTQTGFEWSGEVDAEGNVTEGTDG